MFKGWFGRGLAMILSAVMIIGTIWISDISYAKADEPAGTGTVSFDVNGGGRLEYKTNNNDAWTSVENNASLTKDDLSDVTDIYLRAIPESGKKLDDNTDSDRNYTQQSIRFNNEDHFIND